MVLTNFAIALFGVVAPPVAVGLAKGLHQDFIVNLILTFFIPFVGGIGHAFQVFGIPPMINLLSVILPPVSVLVNKRIGMDFLANVLFTMIGDIPGIVHAYFIALESESSVLKGVLV